MGEISECRLPKMSRWGDSYFDKVENLNFGLLPSCCILLTDFRTVIVFLGDLSFP